MIEDKSERTTVNINKKNKEKSQPLSIVISLHF